MFDVFIRYNAPRVNPNDITEANITELRLTLFASLNLEARIILATPPAIPDVIAKIV